MFVVLAVKNIVKNIRDIQNCLFCFQLFWQQLESFLSDSVGLQTPRSQFGSKSSTNIFYGKCIEYVVILNMISGYQFWLIRFCFMIFKKKVKINAPY